MKDARGWLRAGATRPDLAAAIASAVPLRLAVRGAPAGKGVCHA